MDKRQLLTEIDGVLGSMPKMIDFASVGGSADAWLGRVNAILGPGLSLVQQLELQTFNHAIEQGMWATTERTAAIRGVIRLLNMVRHELLMETGGTGTVAIDQGMHFQYFEALRGIIQTATSEVFFVDPFLNEDVLSKFCAFAKDGVPIRLLGTRYMATLKPAAEALNQQRSGVRLSKSEDIHDRYVFIDGSRCYLSGASFKDGPKNALSIVTEVVDFGPLLALHEAKWGAATVLI